MSKQLLIRGLDDEVLMRLRTRARQNRRSLEAEARVVLEGSVGVRPAKADAAMWKLADEMRERLKGSKQTDSAILIREFRDE